MAPMTQRRWDRLRRDRGFESLEGRVLLAPTAADLDGVRRAPIAEVAPGRPAGNPVRARRAERTGPVVAATELVYRSEGGRAEALDLYRPAGPAPEGGWPVVLAIHGGGWRRFGKEGYGRTVAAALTPSGYVVVAPNYTLSAPGAPSWPANFEDVRAAVRWVRLNAVALGVDPGRIAAIGESSGGHLAALLGTYPEGHVTPEGLPSSGPGLVAGDVSARVQAVVDFSGPADLPALVAQSRSGGLAVRQFLGGPPEQVPGRYRAASPVAHASADDAPALIVQGTEDPIVPRAQSEALAAALAGAGVPSRLILIPGAGHGFGPRAGRLPLRLAVVAFLDTALRREGSGPS
jgi:acetyl esterase/lipase